MPARVHVRSDERLVVTGATGTGKTTFCRALLLPRIPRTHCFVAVDPKRDSNWRHLKDVRVGWGGVDLKPGPQAFRWPSIRSEDDGSGEFLAKDRNFNRLLRAIWARGNVIMLVDETSALFPAPHTMTGMMGRLIREGRQRNIGIWWLVQRPAQLPQIILTEAEAWAVFTLRRALDRKTAADFMGDEVAAPLPQEEGRSHFFWWCRPGMARPKILRLNLN